MNGFRIFAGNSNPSLARGICELLPCGLGEATVSKFSDGEIRVNINESVRGSDIFAVQSISSAQGGSVNDHLMELLIMIDALKRASAASISAVVPYFGYGRQDRRGSGRNPISARLICDLLTAAGANRIIAMELHAGQIQGFFNGPVDHLYASPVLVEHLQQIGLANLVVVSPDAGGVDRARAYAQKLDAGLAIVDKRRSAPNVAEVMHVIGDVSGRDAILVDDMIDTAGTLVHAANALREHGARRIFAAATHPVLSGPAIDRISESCIEGIVVTDTVPLASNAQSCGKIQVVSVASIFAEAIRQVHAHGSVQGMFRGEPTK